MKLRVALQRPDSEILARFASLTTRQDVADLLEIPDKFLVHILYRRRDPTRYRQFQIPKRSGGYRTISAPPAALQILQSKLNHVLQLAYRVRDSVHGFVRERGILTNAREHVAKRWVLNVDLEDYFPSINFGRVRGALMAQPYGLGTPAATVIAQICCADNSLPQGAPTSPMLANIVTARLDGALRALAKRHGCTFTRYADDITISSRLLEFPSVLARRRTSWIGLGVELGEPLISAVEENGFHINLVKTRLQLRSCHQEVTGLTVNEFPNVARRFVREVRAALHNLKTLGPDKAQLRHEESVRKRGRGRPTSGDLRRVVKGRIEFIGMVRGTRDPVYCKLRAALHTMAPDIIGPPPPAEPRVLTLVESTPSWSRYYQAFAGRVFLLEIHKTNGDISGATAFVVNEAGLATAAHTLVGRVYIQLHSTNVTVDEVLPHKDYNAVDCALIPVTHGLTPLQYHRKHPFPGDPVAVIGFARVPGRLPSLGIYQGRVESLATNHNGSVTFIQISVPSAGGLSGSPVIDRKGRVVGIVIESTFEETGDEVPGREFCSVLPIEHVLNIDPSTATLTRLPLG